jgi:hypothetical protein
LTQDLYILIECFCFWVKSAENLYHAEFIAIANITEAVELYLESLMADHQPIPKEDYMDVICPWVRQSLPRIVS